MTTAADVERLLVREGAVEASYEQQLAEAIRERDRAREHAAQVRAEVREMLRDVATRQREACARYMDEQRWYTSRAALSAPLVTEVEP